MNINSNNNLLAIFDPPPVYEPDGAGYTLDFEEEAQDGTTTPFDLAAVLPITYRVKKYSDVVIVEKTIPDGQLSNDGMFIQGDNNEVLAIDIDAQDIEGVINITHRHELIYTFADGTTKTFWRGDIPFKDLFS